MMETLVSRVDLDTRHPLLGEGRHHNLLGKCQCHDMILGILERKDGFIHVSLY